MYDTVVSLQWLVKAQEITEVVVPLQHRLDVAAIRAATRWPNPAVQMTLVSTEIAPTDSPVALERFECVVLSTPSNEDNSFTVDLLEGLTELASPEEPPVEGLVIHHVIHGALTKGWLHTHGMDQYGLPELEMRNVPAFLIEPAARILNQTCRYMRQPGVVVKEGETMQFSADAPFRFVRSKPIPGSEDHYQVERWELVEIPTRCAHCGAVHHDDE